MLRFLTCFTFFLLVNTYLFSQTSKGSFYVTGKVKVDQGVVDGTHIELFRDGTKIEDMIINRTGTFRVIIELNSNYRFFFNNDNYYPKTIDFDTHIPKGVCETDCNFPPYELALILYKKVIGVNEVPQAPSKISYNKQLDVFDPEILRQGSDLKKMIGEALASAKQKSILYDQKKIMDKKLDYEKNIKDGDTYFRSGELENAMSAYRNAAMILPDEKYPRDKVDQAYYLLVSSHMQKSFGNPSENNFLKYLNYGDLKFSEREYTVAKVAYECALAVKPDDQSIKTKYLKSEEEVAKIKNLAWEEIDHKKKVYASREIKYKELIAEGDAKLAREDVVGAKDLYAQAATQIDENSYALLMMQKIGEIISNEDLAIRLTREREEADKKRLADARNKAYNDAVAEADRLFYQRLYLDAIEYYELALSIKEYELYPKKQIETIKDILAKLQLNGEEYNRLLRDGDLSMEQKNYPLAKEIFTKAHSLIPDEKYALRKIEEINLLLAKQTEENIINKQYLAVLAKADSLFNLKKYSDAINPYQKASSIKPAEKYPKDQILKIRGILSRENDEQKALLQKQTDYDNLISQADNAFNTHAYLPARSLYLKALQIFPGQEYPSSQIQKIEDILSKTTNNTKKSTYDEIDLSALQNMSDKEREKAFREAMDLGESFMKSKDWAVARFYFKKAITINPEDPVAIQRLNDAEKLIRGNDVNESKFNEFIKKADESFKTGDISVSKFYYTKALEIKPNDSYTKERLDISDKLLRATQSSAGDREFEDAINKGNEAFAAKNYTLARFFYRKATSLKPTNQKAIEKLQQSEEAIENEKASLGNSEYNRNIKLGDQAFQHQNYSLALTYYKQALANKTNDQYSIGQIAKVEALLKNK